MSRNIDFAHRRPVGKWGFTLVELLVVIGIIALLISILLPALKKAQQAGAAANCAANLKQLGIAITMYANDNKGWAPRAASGGAGHAYDDFIWWQTKPQTLALDKSALAPYLGISTNVPVGPAVGSGATLGFLAPNPLQPGSEKIQKIMRCPGDIGVEERPQIDPNREAAYGGYHYSYSMNSWFNSMPPDIVNGTDGGPGASRFKFSQVKRPADKLLMGEEQNPNDGYWVIQNYTPGSDDMITTRHGGMGNILFCDTHVERIDPKWFGSNQSLNISRCPFSDQLGVN